MQLRIIELDNRVLIKEGSPSIWFLSLMFLLTHNQGIPICHSLADPLILQGIFFPLRLTHDNNYCISNNLTQLM